MDNGRAPGSGATIATTTGPDQIGQPGQVGQPGQIGQPHGSTALRLTRRGRIVRSTLITIMILLVALVAGLFAGGISGLI